VLISRDDLLHQILETHADAVRVDELAGVLGAGKTSLLEKLDAATPAFGVRSVVMPLEDFDPGHHGEAGPAASVGAVQGSFHEYTRLLQAVLARGCSPEASLTFAREVTEAQNAEVGGLRVFSLEDSVAELTVSLAPATLADAWREAARAVSRRFVAHWDTLSESSSVMLLLDNVDAVADQEFGVWLSELLPRLRRTAVVVTRAPGGPALSLPGLRPFEIQDLSLAEIKDFLTARVRGRLQDPDVRAVHAITAGHPATLAIVQELVWPGGGGPTVDPKEVLKRLPAQRGERVALLLEELLDAKGDPLLKRALDAAAVTRSLSPLLLRRLLRDPAVSEGEASRLFTELERLPLVGKPWGDDGSLRLHSFVRDSLLDRLSRLESESFKNLHAAAADYYHDLLVGTGSDDSPNSYGEAFIYEDPQWQSRKREWLYHITFAASDRRQSILVEFARVFFDAFWWWGNYVHFDFCDRLLADLGQLADRVAPLSGNVWRPGPVDPAGGPWTDLRSLSDALRRVLQGYPLRSMKPGVAEWGDVRLALLGVQNLCGLDKVEPGVGDLVDQHVAALLNVFLAHTWRYEAGQQPKADRFAKADRYYARAGRLFAKTDEWSPGWVAYERADLRFENDDRPAVGELWRQAAEVAQPRPDGDGPFSGKAETDEELASNLHRLRADYDWTAGQRDAAAAGYGRAVLHAYLFNFAGPAPPSRGQGGPAPDLYTLQFYVDIRARAINRLLALWRDGDQDGAVACATSMATVVAAAFGRSEIPAAGELQALIGAGRPVPLAEALFPVGAQVADLESGATKFATDYLLAREELDWTRLGSDLHEIPWP